MKVEGTVRVDAYKVIAEAVESGISYGWNRAHKHDPNPSEDAIKDIIHQAVLNALCEVLVFGD